jgi:hypothetical protein
MHKHVHTHTRPCRHLPPPRHLRTRRLTRLMCLRTQETDTSARPVRTGACVARNSYANV